MSEIKPPSLLAEIDYEAIETAVMETSRGRWFLAEYARRNRTADTTMLLDAIGRLERTIQNQNPGSESAMPAADRFQSDLLEMAKAIARTKAEIASIKPDRDTDGRFALVTGELDEITQATEQATNEILGAAEEIQEVAWTLREQGFDGDTCDTLDRRATEIYTSCSFQDLTGQRIKKVVDVVRFLEQRINSMIDIWGVEEITAPSAYYEAPGAARMLNGPSRRGEGMAQPEIDDVVGAGFVYASGDIEWRDAARGRQDAAPAPVVIDTPPTAAQSEEAAEALAESIIDDLTLHAEREALLDEAEAEAAGQDDDLDDELLEPIAAEAATEDAPADEAVLAAADEDEEDLLEPMAAEAPAETEQQPAEEIAASDEGGELDDELLEVAEISIEIAADETAADDETVAEDAGEDAAVDGEDVAAEAAAGETTAEETAAEAAPVAKDDWEGLRQSIADIAPHMSREPEVTDVKAVLIEAVEARGGSVIELAASLGEATMQEIEALDFEEQSVLFA